MQLTDRTPHARHHRLFEAVTTITHAGEPHGAGGGDDGDDDGDLPGDRGDDFTPTDPVAGGGEKTDPPAGDKPAGDKPPAGDGGEKDGDKPAGAAKEGEEEEEEETDEERAEREAAEAAAEKAKRIRVPKARLDEVTNRARQREEQLLARIEELQKDKAPPKDVLAEMRTSISELQDKYEAHIFAGEKDEAKAVRAQLEEAREKYTDAKTAKISEATRLQTIDSLKYDAALARVEAEHPALNPDNDETFDGAKANEVAELMGLFERNGLTKQASLEKAVRYVMGPASARPTDTAADTMRKRQEQQAREKAAKAAKQQPPDASKTGSDNDKSGGERPQGINVMQLSQDKFAELDEQTLARMRGDDAA